MQVVGKFLGSTSEKDTKALLVIHLNLVVYAGAFWLCQPVFPYLSKSLGASTITFGYLQTVFSIAQMIGSVVFGRLSDKMGARTCLHLTQVGSALSYFFLGAADSLLLLFLSRMMSVLQHGMMSGQAAVVKYTSKETRRSALGRLSLSYGIGMVVGSAVGGALSSATSFSFVAFVASFLSAAVIPITHFYLSSPVPPSTKTKTNTANNNNKKRKNKNKNSEENSSQRKTLIESLKEMLGRKGVIEQVMILVSVGMAFSLQKSSFSMMAEGVFGLEASSLGLLMSFGGVLSILTNGLLLPLLPPSLSDLSGLFFACLFLVPVFVGYSHVPSLLVLYILLVPVSVLSTVIYTLNTSILSKLATNNSGLLIGMNHFISSGLGILSPTIAAYLIHFSPKSIGYSAAFLCAFSALLIQLLSPQASAKTTKISKSSN